MRVDSAISSNSLLEQSGTGKAHSANATPARNSADDSVRSTLTSRDQEPVHALVSQAMNMPDPQQDRIHALRTAVENGEYRVAPEQIAAAMYGHFLR